MTIQEIRALAKADPFQPFVIAYKTGKNFKVVDPERIWIPPVPTTTSVFVATGRGSYVHLDVTWIEDVKLIGGGRGGSSRRRKAG